MRLSDCNLHKSRVVGIGGEGGGWSIVKLIVAPHVQHGNAINARATIISFLLSSYAHLQLTMSCPGGWPPLSCAIPLLLQFAITFGERCVVHPLFTCTWPKISGAETDIQFRHTVSNYITLNQ